MRAISSLRNARSMSASALIAFTTMCTFPAIAQISPPLDDEAPAESQPTQKFWLRVTGERVNIRSRADANSRIVGIVNTGDVLEAVGEDYGWFRIAPPKGVFSIVAAQYIDRVGGDRGVVNVDTALRVRVGSDIQDRDPELSEVQTRLKTGDEVEILGQLNEQWLKIVPPAGVYVYIWGEFTERISAEQAAQSAGKAPVIGIVETTTTPTPSPTEPVAEVQPAESQPTQTAPAPPEQPREAATKPPASQPVAKCQASQSRAPETAPALEPKPIEPAPRTPMEAPKRPFDARGVLRPCFTIEPGEYGLRYTLSDGATHKINAYIEIPPELDFDAPASVGKYVGAHGVWTEDQQSGVKVLRATHVTVLLSSKP